MVNYRRRRQWHAWLPLGVGKCRLLTGAPCPYYREGCADYAQWSKAPAAALPPCFAERHALLGLADSLTASGWPSALATIVASAMLRANRDGDGRLLGDALRTANGIGIELVRAAARRTGGAGAGEIAEASECLRGLLETGARQ